MSDALNRREFLVYAGATVAGVTLGEIGRRQLARADARAAVWHPRAPERWTTSVCAECPAACGVRVRLVDDVPVKLEGNPRCPIAHGRLCAKGQAALESYFDPDRLTGPARRIGKRGERQWQPVTWTEALALVTAGIQQTPADPPARPLALGGRERGPLADAWLGFWRAAGARVAWTGAPVAERLRPSFTALTGVDDADPVFDLEHATYVLSFGAPLVEDWLSAVWAQRSYGRFRRSAAHGRGRLVHVDERRSLTARKADEWIAVGADRQALLAYGIASVILREGRGDRVFLDEFATASSPFETELLARYSPDDVAAATGVPVVTILRLARELAAHPQALVVVAADADRTLVDAVFALNAIVGAYDRRGGVLASARQPTIDAEDANSALREIGRGARQPSVVAFRDASPLRAMDAPHLAGGALDGVPLVMSFSPYLDETADLADLLLPTHTALERWHAVIPATAHGIESLAVAAPAVQPRLDTRDLAALLKDIAQAVGAPLNAACPWASSEDLVRAELTHRADQRRGGPYSTPYETEWLRQLEAGGWWVPAAGSRDSIVATILEAGGWMDPAMETGRIRESLRARGGLTFTIPVTSTTEHPMVGNLGATEAATSPVQRTPAVGRARRSLRLVPFTPHVVSMAGGPNQPVLFELLGQPDGAPWRVWAEMNAETARELGLANGDTMRITSDQGSIEAAALLVERMPPDLVAVAYVPGPTGGRWARLIDADVRRLCGDLGFVEPCHVRVART